MPANDAVLVFSEKPALLAELISAARGLLPGGAGTVTAVVLGARADAEQALARGADSVLWLGELKPGALVDDVVLSLDALVTERAPFAVLIGATKRGRAVAGRLAARHGVSVLTDVLEFIPRDGTLEARHMIFGGGAMRVDRPLSGPVIATIGPGTFDAAPAQPDKGGEIVEAAWVEPPWKVTVREHKPRPASKVNLAGAKKVVCSGRGVVQKDDLGMLEELARLLGAELACTRPLAEGLDWLPLERYIGISGAQIKPDLYLGVGVSGQVQHVIGMGDSRVVVAINKDRSAPIFAHADYAIVDDLYNVVPALIKALKAR